MDSLAGLGQGTSSSSKFHALAARGDTFVVFGVHLEVADLTCIAIGRSELEAHIDASRKDVLVDAVADFSRKIGEGQRGHGKC